MSSDYYPQCKGPANDLNNSIDIDSLLITLFCIVLLLPVVLHFSDTIFSHTQTILLIFAWKFITGFKFLCRLYDILQELQWFQPPQQNSTVKLYHKNKRRQDQASPPSEDNLHVAVQRIQLSLPSSTEELVYLAQHQATIQLQQQSSLLSPTVQLTPVSTTPVAKHDRALQEFIKGEDHC